MMNDGHDEQVEQEPMSDLPMILCCICSDLIQANDANMCISCLRSQVDVTEGIAKELTMYQCRGCLKWARPPWVAAQLESRELLAICLKKITGLSKVKLVDAGWVWTEPHCKRLKIKLTVQKEVFRGTILQQSFVVLFVIRNQQCDTCQAMYCNQSWKAVVQVRQKVEHKRTFYFLEQLILKHRAHEKASSIKSFPDGLDFYFTERNQAIRFQDFLEETVPIKLKNARKLISADNHSNTHNFKFTYYAEIAGVCKDDLVLIPEKTARVIGSMSRLCLVKQVAAAIHVVDPHTLQQAAIDGDKYWRNPFKALMSFKALTEYTVLDSTPVASTRKFIRVNRKTRLAEVEVVRNSDFGVNDQRFIATSHLGHLLKAGDTVLGYDLTTAVLSEATDDYVLPDVILVRKLYPRRAKKSERNWHLKKMEGVEESVPLRKVDQNMVDSEYDRFLEELEEDKDMRSQINLYQSQPKLKHNEAVTESNPVEEDGEDETGPSIAIDELLEDLSITSSAPSLVDSNNAQHQKAFEIDDL